MLLFSRTNTTKAQLGTLTLNLAHIGWIMAIHLKNSTGAEMDLPESIRFEDPTSSTTSYFWNGAHTSNVVEMDVAAGTLVSTKQSAIIFEINAGSWLPLSGQKLAAGAEQVLYRWLVSTPQVNQMRARMLQKGAGSYDYSTNNLPARTVQKGKVYHTFLNWDGTNLKITNRAGTAY